MHKFQESLLPRKNILKLTTKLRFNYNWLIFYLFIYLFIYFLLPQQVLKYIVVYTYSKIKSHKKSYKIFDFKSRDSTFYKAIEKRGDISSMQLITSLPADVLWGSIVTQPKRTSAGRLTNNWLIYFRANYGFKRKNTT